MSSTAALIGWILLICAVELLMWQLFRIKVSSICFAKGAPRPRGSFTVAWLRLIAIVHSAVMLVTIILFYSLLW